MSTTPETDAAEYKNDEAHGGMVVSADFARRLEQQREAWRKVADGLACALELTRKKLDRVATAAAGDGEISDYTLELLGQGKSALAAYDALKAGKIWCAACGKYTDHGSGTCPTITH